MLKIIKDGLTRAIKDVYEFRIDVSADSTKIHVYLDAYYRTQRNKILENSPRWRRNDSRFSTLDHVKIPKKVTTEVLEHINSNIILHYPDKEPEND